jgi:hypothetical protein
LDIGNNFVLIILLIIFVKTNNKTHENIPS